MKPETLLHLFNFENCIDHMHNWLCENTYLVNKKFKQFEIVLQRNNIITVCDAVKTIRESDVFNSESLIDCELLTCAVNDILYTMRAINNYFYSICDFISFLPYS